jgi:16S rRNA (uracil1498-N3)-methyltransferase
MARFYIDQKITGETATISDKVHLHHIRDVLRLKAGDKIALFDTEGKEYLGIIFKLDRKLALIRVKVQKQAASRKRQLTIACAIPKKSRMDDVVDKLTQLGVDTIIPMETERVIVKLNENHTARLERWRKIARSAAEQSQRNTLPIIPGILTLKEVLAESRNYRLKLLPTVSGERKTLKEVLTGPEPESIIILIGPEGDFAAQEVDQSHAAGFISVSLGDNVMRVETAAAAIASYIKLSLVQV